MAVFVQKWLYSGKFICFRAKVVVFRQKLFVFVKKVIAFGQSGCIRDKVVLCGQSVCNRA